MTLRGTQRMNFKQVEVEHMHVIVIFSAGWIWKEGKIFIATPSTAKLH
jgi:hypothetical protein